MYQVDRRVRQREERVTPVRRRRERGSVAEMTQQGRAADTVVGEEDVWMTSVGTDRGTVDERDAQGRRNRRPLRWKRVAACSPSHACDTSCTRSGLIWPTRRYGFPVASERLNTKPNDISSITRANIEMCPPKNHHSLRPFLRLEES